MSFHNRCPKIGASSTFSNSPKTCIVNNTHPTPLQPQHKPKKKQQTMGPVVTPLAKTWMTTGMRESPRGQLCSCSTTCCFVISNPRMNSGYTPGWWMISEVGLYMIILTFIQWGITLHEYRSTLLNSPGQVTGTRQSRKNY